MQITIAPEYLRETIGFVANTIVTRKEEILAAYCEKQATDDKTSANFLAECYKELDGLNPAAVVWAAVGYIVTYQGDDNVTIVVCNDGELCTTGKNGEIHAIFHRDNCKYTFHT
jgi:hypothetical protein